jgi:hypothetical protein
MLPLDQVSATMPRSLRASDGTSIQAPTYTVTTYMLQPRAMIKKMPGFFFSSYRQTTTAAPVLLRMDDYQRLLSEAYTKAGYANMIPAVPPKAKLLVCHCAPLWTRVGLPWAMS